MVDSLSRIESYLQTINFATQAADIIDKAVRCQWQTLTYFFVSAQSAKRAMRCMYRLMAFYPELKSRINLKVSGLELRVKITDKEERRGRRHL